MQRRTAHRVVAIFVAVLVVSFAFQAAGHWHNPSFDDHHCRVCHVAHSVVADLSQVSALAAPDAIVGLISTRPVSPELDQVFHQFSSRAPPA